MKATVHEKQLEFKMYINLKSKIITYHVVFEFTF